MSVTIIQNFFRTLWRVSISLKLAVLVIIALTLSCIAATFLESIYDTQTAQYWVYRSIWFYGILALLGVNIAAVAISRWPWKKRHGPFLMAHLGIIILLWGSFETFVRGLDGSMRLEEGKPSQFVEMPNATLTLSEGGESKVFPVKWVPTNVHFKPMKIPDYPIRIEKFITHAEPEFHFSPSRKDFPGARTPALKVIVRGGVMKIVQEYWLWAGDPGFASIQAGPARLGIGSFTQMETGRPTIQFVPQPDGSLIWKAQTSDGKKPEGKLKREGIQGAKILPGWRGGVEIELAEWIPNAAMNVTYKPSRLDRGSQAPPSAIYVIAGSGGPDAEMWLGLGDRAILDVGGKALGLAYYPERERLPFAILLDRFEIDYYEGSRDPKSYSSRVRVVENGAPQEPVVISMNEPLQHGGITFYQASYEDARPRPTVSVLSVNRDPGRFEKYLGSLLIVLGAVWLFAEKNRKKKKEVPA